MPLTERRRYMTTVIRSKDYGKAVNVLVADQIVIDLAKEVAKEIKADYAHTLKFMREALNEYHYRQGKNPDTANHHIGAVAEAIREINKW